MTEKDTETPVTAGEEQETVVNAPPEEQSPDGPAAGPDPGDIAAEFATVEGVEMDQLAPVSNLDEVLDAEQLSFVDKATDETSERARFRAIVEAIVYVTEEPLTANQIAVALEEPVERVERALVEITAEFDQPGHGLTVRQLAEGYMMGTKAEHHEAIRAFVKKLQKPLKLSMAALETLAVVAYKQPITAPEIMEIRGVQGAGVLKTLLDRKLVVTAGRKNVIGKPILYRTTKDFLVQFGLKNLNELPTLKEFEELARIALADEEEPTGPADRESDAAAPDTAGERQAPESEENSDSDTEPPGESAATAAEPIGPKSETVEVELEDEQNSRTASED